MEKPLPSASHETQISSGNDLESDARRRRIGSGPKSILPSRIQPALFLPLLALLIVSPLLRNGPSCGHDYGFHLQSWMDAGEQLRHGHLLPRWAFSPAFNAGEPRFVFYPPISWLLGALLLLVLPAPYLTTAFTFVALSGAGLAMYALARRFCSREAALVAAALYIGNPYIFFTAYERTAYAELLAAAWLPLLFRAALAERPRALSAAIPLALLWLTNAPAAVMGTYALVVVMLLRAGLAWRQARAAREGLSETVALLLTQGTAALLLGVSLPAFYLLPAAYERRYVQIAMAIIPNMRVEDNFLFGHTGYGPHDQVLHTASIVALELALMTAVVLGVAAIAHARATPKDTAEGKFTRSTFTVLAALATVIVVLLWHPTLPLWHLLPEMVFLQFPWRLLALLGCLLGIGAALALARLGIPPAMALIAATLIVGAATYASYPQFRQGCETNELPADRLALFRSRHGVGPTDEYTPTPADNDQLRWHDPAFWLTQQPNSPAPDTVPNPAATDPDYDALPPLAETVSGRAPTHLQLQLPRPENLVLNLRDYPAWQVAVNGNTHVSHLQRDDGLLAVALPAGRSTLDVRWRTLPDVWAGDTLSLMSLGVSGWLWRRSRRISN